MWRGEKKDCVVAVVAGNIKLEFVFLFLWNFLFPPSVLGTTAFDRDAPEAVDCVYDRHWKHLHRRHKKKKRELNCSPPQGNCWSGAFAKYLRSTSSLTSKSWLGEETVSSVGLSPNCGLVNSEGGTWARTPGRYQLLDHGGRGDGGDYEDEDTLRDPHVFLLLLCSFLSLSSPHHHFIHQLHWLRLSYVVSNY